MAAIGTLTLAAAAFTEIISSSQARQLSALEQDFAELSRSDEQSFPGTARRTFGKWLSDPRSRYLIVGMLDDYEARRLQYHEELSELRGDLQRVRSVLGSAHPEIDDGGWAGSQLIADSSDPAGDTLARFDELAQGAEIDLQREWRGPTRYNSPPDRDPEDEEPAVETHMLSLLVTRKNRLFTLQQQGHLNVDDVFLAEQESLRRRWSEIHNAFLDWKRDYPQAAMHNSLLVLRSWTASTRESRRFDLGHPAVQGDTTGLSLQFRYDDYLKSHGHPDDAFVRYSPIQDEMLFALSGLVDRHRSTSSITAALLQKIDALNPRHRGTS